MFLDCAIFVVFDDASITFVIESAISPMAGDKKEILAGTGEQVGRCPAFFNSGV